MPWFGQTQPVLAGGTNTAAPPAANKAACKFDIDRNGALTSIHFYFNTAPGTNSRAIIYNSAGVGGLPGALVGVSSESSSALQWVKYTFSPTIALTVAGGPYWIGIWSTGAGASRCNALTNGIAFNANTYSGTLPPSDPFGASPTMANVVYPVFANYDLPADRTWIGYPSVAGPNITGGAADNTVTTANNVIVFPVAADSGSIASISFQLTRTTAVLVKGVIYDSTGTSGAPGTLLGTSAEISAQLGINTMTFATAVNVSGNIYIGLHANANVITFLGQAAGVTTYIKSATYSGGPPGTFGTGTPSTNQLNLWANGAFFTSVSVGGKITAVAAAAGFPTMGLGVSGIIASATVKAHSTARLARATVTTQLAARLNARSAARLAQIPLRLNVAGRMTTRGSGRIAELNVRVVTGRITGRLAARASAIVARPDANRQYQVSINAR